eukprot:TRINITY_DN2886_c0_g1_i1.p1 TRINITY_DN2886_c0_g1~~TRINITY_DN2886_c0_g1_i1.p1  ORF type:complete len:371 (-),score=64.45 TRINITY_DN2886_c0_g1_i1:50-1162(-)
MLVLVLVVVVLLGLLSFPPGSRIFHHYYSNYHPYGKIAKIISIQSPLPTYSVWTAMKMGIFEALAAGPLTSHQVASKVGSPERGVIVLLDFLVTLDLISVKKNQFCLLPSARDHLLQSAPAYMGGMVSIGANEIFHKRFIKLPEAIMAGQQIFDKDTAETPDHPYWHAFASITKEMSIRPAQKMVECVKARLKMQPFEVLDLACGSGVYGYVFSAAFPNANVTLFDQFNVIPVAKKWMSHFPEVSTDRINFVEGDVFAANFEEKFDVIILSHFYNHFSMEVNVETTKRVRCWLKKGGVIVVNAFLKEGDHPSFFTNPFSWEFSLYSFIWTDHGDSFYFEDYHKMFKAASFDDVSLIKNHPLPNAYVIARK